MRNTLVAERLPRDLNEQCRVLSLSDDAFRGLAAGGSAGAQCEGQARRIVLEDPFVAPCVLVLDEVPDRTIFVGKVSGPGSAGKLRNESKSRRLSSR